MDFRIYPVIVSLLFITTSVEAQEDNTAPEISFGAYLDMFYGYDFNQPTTTERLPYLYHHNRHASFNINHAVVSVKLNHPRYRANVAFQAGTYVLDNYSAEPDLYKTIFDANIGLALNKKSTIWLDVGIFGNSYIGFERTFNFTNVALSHNLISENVPYYFSGIRGSYTPDDHWYIALILANGWQRIQMVEGSSVPSLGTQVTYSFDKLEINWSGFLGTDDPDATRRMRVYNAFYGLFDINDKWNVHLGVDFGLQQISKGDSQLNSWFGVAALGQYTLSEKWQFGGRIEYFSDPNGVLVQSANNQFAYKTGGYSVNADFLIFKNLKWRMEARLFNGQNPIYPKDGATVNSNFFLLTALVFDFQSKPLNHP